MRSGIGAALEEVPSCDVEGIRSKCAARNECLLAAMREDEHSTELLERTLCDARLGRLSHPQPADLMCLDQVLLHPRFSVSQSRPDGSVKIRPVDHFSWSGCDRQKENSVNGHTAPREKLSHETLDELAVAMKHFVGAVNETPGLVKADIDAAFRRVPIRPDHRWAAGIAFRVGFQVRGVGYCAPARLSSLVGSLRSPCRMSVRRRWICARMGANRCCNRARRAVLSQASAFAIRGRLLWSRAVRMR